MAANNQQNIQLLLQVGFNQQQVQAILQVFAQIQQASKTQAQVERDANNQLNILLREAIAARRKAAADQKAILKEVERDQQEAIRREIVARKEAMRQEEEEIKKRETAQRTSALAGARSFVSLGFGTWSIPGMAQDQSQLADNILLGAAAIEQFGAQMGNVMRAAREANMSFIGLAAGMLPALVAATAITVGFKALENRINEVGKAEAELAAERERHAKIIADNVGKERSMSSSQLKFQIMDTDARLGSIGGARSENVQRILDLQAQLKAIDEHGLLMGAENFVKRQEVQKQIEEENKALDKLNPKYKELVDQQLYNTQVLEPLIKKWEAFNKTLDIFDTEADRYVTNQKLTRTGSSSSVEETVTGNTDRIMAEQRKQWELQMQLRYATTEAERQTIKDRIQTSKEMVDKLTADNEELKNSVLPLIYAREAEEADIKAVTKADDERNKKIEQTIDKIQQYSKEIEDFQNTHAREKARQAEEDAIDEERRGIEAGYKKKIDDAREAERQAEHRVKVQKIIDDAARVERQKDQDFQLQKQKINERYNNRVDDINRNYMDQQLKALEKFHKEAIAKEDDYWLKRARLIEDANDNLIKLAAERDVMGFILEQKELAKKLRRLDEDHGIEAKSNQDAFADQMKEAQDARDKQLEAARLDHELQLKEAQDSYYLDKAQREAQLRERLQQEEDAFQIRISRADQLEKELQALREQWQIDDNKRRREIEEEDYKIRLQTMKDKLTEQRQALINYMNEATAIVQSGGKTSGAESAKGQQEAVILAGQTIGRQQGPVNTAATQATNAQNYSPSSSAYLSPSYIQKSLGSLMNSLPRFASGMDYVPKDYFPMFADEGEAVLNKREAEAWRSAKSGPRVSLTINYSTSELASKQDLYTHGGELMQIVSNTFERL